MERDVRERNLRQGKLNLVVDLDQTVLHASVDPHLEQWIRDPESPEALKVALGVLAALSPV